MRPLVVFLCLAALLIPSGASADDVVLTVTVDNPAVSGAGGGGGGERIWKGAVRFIGLAYPQSRVTLLKDGQAAASALASADGSFRLEVTGLPAGTYVFSLFAEDAEGGFSSLFSVPLLVNANVVTSVAGIFLSPTLRLAPTPDASVGASGRQIIISGQSAPRAQITLRITSGTALGMSLTTSADSAKGGYSYLLNSRRLAAGDYLVQSRASLPGPLSSDWSKPVRFRIGKDGTVELLPVICPPVADLDNDCRVNLVDFSIMVYWFQNPNPPAEVDLNGDGIVNLTDLSIATYYWTG